MKYKYYLIKNKKYQTMPSWWAYVVDDEKSFEHILTIRAKHLIGCRMHAKKLELSYNDHLTTEEWAIVMACENRNTKSLIDEATVIDNVFLKPIVNMYLKGKVLLFNYNGGFCWITDDLEILDTVISDVYAYPQSGYTKSDIKVSQWMNGNHYYAKVKNVDVVDRTGRQKWDSYDRAYDEAVDFISRATVISQPSREGKE